MPMAWALYGNAGSQGFPGFQPSDEARRTRRSQALYADWEVTPTSALTVDAALRAEHYSDFGNTPPPASWPPAPRPPRPAAARCREHGLSRAEPAAALFLVHLHGLHQPATARRRAGAQRQQDHAGRRRARTEAREVAQLHARLHLEADRSFEATVDAYQIKIKDRIVLSGRFDDSNYPALGAILQGLGVGRRSSSSTGGHAHPGLDVTASHRSALGAGKLNTFLALNLSRTTVTGVHAPAMLKGFEDVLLSERERLFIEQYCARQGHAGL